MEQMSDRDLDDLLAAWRAPSVSQDVERRIVQYQNRRWLMWLLKGHIELPAPALALIICTVVTLIALVAERPMPRDSSVARSEGLQPVKHLQVRIIRSGYETRN